MNFNPYDLNDVAKVTNNKDQRNGMSDFPTKESFEKMANDLHHEAVSGLMADTISEITRLQSALKEAREDAERLATGYLSYDQESGNYNCQCGGWGFGDEGIGAIDHKSGCPIAFHRQLVEKWKKEGG